MARRILSHANVRVFAVFALAFASSAFAQADTAYIPFTVNVNAIVRAAGQGLVAMSMDVTANTESTFRIPIGMLRTGVTRQKPAGARENVPSITGSHRGKVLLSLPESYKAAEISLYSVNGKRILRARAGVSEAPENLSRPNLTAGVYTLSVKGAGGRSFSSRLTHGGGGFSINAAFGSETAPASPAAVLSKQAASDVLEYRTITVSAPGYFDSSYTLGLVKGANALQEITLRIDDECSSGDHFNPDIDYGCFTDKRDGQKYRTVVIGGQTWMAENLNYNINYDITRSRCYRDSAEYCDLYGRLYNWSTARYDDICPVGWHLPSDAEWAILVRHVDPDYVPVTEWDTPNIAATRLKSRSGWDTGGNYIAGTDDFGFSALPGGNCYGGKFGSVGGSGMWWSATEAGWNSAWARGMAYFYAQVVKDYHLKGFLFSVRCVKD